MKKQNEGYGFLKFWERIQKKLTEINCILVSSSN
jgi:hypothetical protein